MRSFFPILLVVYLAVLGFSYASFFVDRSEAMLISKRATKCAATRRKRLERARMGPFPPRSSLSLPLLGILNTCVHECLLVLRDFDANLM